MSDTGRAVAADAYYWTVQRQDGAGFASTSHDRCHEKDGIQFASATALELERLNLTDAMVGSSLELTGAMAGGAVRAQDLSAGRWSNAHFQLATGDWISAAPQRPLCQGELGEIRSTGAGFTAEVSLVPSALGNEACPKTSPECRANLGDHSCRVNLRTLRKRCRVTAIAGQDLMIDLPYAERFMLGQARWLTGVNAGLGATIIEAQANSIRLREVVPHAIEIGDELQITEGCDGRLETCADRFSNVANFRGEPHLPGTDLMVRYPGD